MLSIQSNVITTEKTKLSKALQTAHRNVRIQADEIEKYRAENLEMKETLQALALSTKIFKARRTAGSEDWELADDILRRLKCYSNEGEPGKREKWAGHLNDASTCLSPKSEISGLGSEAGNPN